MSARKTKGAARHSIPQASALTMRNDAVTRDLMRKVQDDVTSLLFRTLDIAPPPSLPILMAAAAVVLGMASAELDHLSDDRAKEPTPDLIILAALLAGRTGIDPTDSVKEAYQDFELLKNAGRIPDDRNAGGAK